MLQQRFKAGFTIVILNIVYRTETPLIMMLSRGLTMSEKDIDKIVPVLATFCSMFSHSLHTLHDADFYEDNTGIVKT